MAREAFPFWRFSLRTYRERGVERACLALQDGFGADVNLLLYCCWTGSEGRSLSPRGVRTAMKTVRKWQDEVVLPLRRARRAIRKNPRGGAAAEMKLLRRRIAAAELDAEYVEQRLLAATAARTSPRVGEGAPREIAGTNLVRYLEALATGSLPRAAPLLRTLAEALPAPAAKLERTRR